MSHNRNNKSDNTKHPAEGGPGQFPVVGIGTSAGGIEALKSFFKVMPSNSDMAFVVIQHLQADQESHLPDIIAHSTKMNVKQVDQTMALVPNTVYVIPPGQLLELHDDQLELLDLPQDRLLRKPIDAFFRSLAQACHTRAIAIVMSGTGGNGSMGVRDIKNHGGIVLVQDPEEALYDSMPRHALATGAVDRSLTIDQMPAVLIGYGHHPYARQQLRDDVPGKHTNVLNNILELLRQRTGREFRCYKKGTLLRRTQRRMGLRQIIDYEKYLDLLKTDHDEVQNLTNDLLIGVTNFFRDREAWDALQENVLSKLIDGRDHALPVRAWTSGCSSGEEAYTLAILLHEQARKTNYHGEIRLFATDSAMERLEVAREGRYPDSIEADVSQDLLSRYFEKIDDYYRIRPIIRDSVVFAPHDLINHPPFSQVDLITCRNLLIYLEPETQAKVLALFHFALRPEGYLFLGRAETVSQQPSLFATISKKWRLYQRVGPTRHNMVSFPLYDGSMAATTELDRLGKRQHRTTKRLDEILNRALAHAYGPPAVLVTQDFECLYFHGSTDHFLSTPAGTPTGNLLEMAREGLRAKLRSDVAKAFETKRRVVSSDLRVRRDDGWMPTRITATPLTGEAEHGALVLVTFEDASPPYAGEVRTRPPVAPGDEHALVKQLEEELANTRAELRTTVADLESSNEEQKASNEEISSINEELQSTNEELETSKEELQSLNEELTTVNQQLHEKVQEVEATNNDLTNLLSSTDITTIFLDSEFRLRWFTPSARNLIPVIPSDMGRPLSDLSHRFQDTDLLEDARKVLRELTPISREVYFPEGGQWFLRRALPYRTKDNHIEGVVITFNDITKLRRAQEHERRLATVVRDSNDAVILLDLQGGILEWNRGAAEMYGWKKSEALGKNMLELVPHEHQSQFKNMIAAAAQRREPERQLRDAESERVTRDGRRITVWSTLSALPDEAGKPAAVAITERDVTLQKQAQAQLKTLNEQLEQRVAERTTLAEKRAEQLRQLALDLTRVEENERRRIAQVLHDDLQQILAAGSLTVSHIRTQKSSDVDKELERLGDLIYHAIRTARDLSHELSPPILQEGLIPALAWAQRWYRDKYDLTINVTTKPGAEPDNSSVRYMLFSAARELLFNVVKHSGAKAAEVELTRTDGQVQLSVHDDGNGLGPDGLKSNQARHAGFGLLNIRERATSLGGRLEIESRPGHGTKVIITVPDLKREKPAPAEVGPPPQPIPPPTMPHPSDSRIRVLLVDDHEVMRNGLAQLLGSDPTIRMVAEADSGENAIKMVAKYHPDVVLMDVNMPGMGGVEATRRITREFPHVAVVALSMHDAADREQIMKEAGAKTYVQKSAPTEEVIKAIRTAASRKSKS